MHFVGAAAGTVCVPLERYGAQGQIEDNITDWALDQFKKHYQPGRGKKDQSDARVSLPVGRSAFPAGGAQLPPYGPSPALADGILQNPAFARAFCTGLVTGSPIRLIGENVTMLNSLQVMYSSRFVYCETDQFSLVEQMLRDNPKYREGLKLNLA